jgi:hypothetical protein
MRGKVRHTKEERYGNEEEEPQELKEIEGLLSLV